MSQPVAPKMILLVEDDPDHEALTMRALRRNNLGHQVTVARDGAAALDLLLGGELAPAEVRGPLPEVVVLDLKLPKIDGLEVLRRLRADGRTRLLPVVVMTSSDEERDLVESYRLGANSYIRKPVDYLAFVEATRELGLYWLNLNVVPSVRAGA